jgi:hypothetical protein
MNLRHKSSIQCSSGIKCACTLCEHKEFAGFFATESCGKRLEELESLPQTQAASTCICGITTLFTISKDEEGIKIDEID